MEDANMIGYDVIEQIVSLEEAMDVDTTLCNADTEWNDEEMLLQQKYVQGTITFAEYSSQLGALYENLEAEDPLDGDLEEVTVGPEDVEAEYEEVEEEKVEKGKKRRKVKKKSATKELEGKVLAEKKVKILRPRVKLEGALKGMLGEATVMFVKKENRQQAIEMVLEVVRQCPNAPEAYKTLATMYEDIGDMATSIKMLLIGAHLSSDNAEEWVQLGAHFERMGDKRQAITCYSKALKADVSLINIHDRRIQLCDEIDLKNRGFVLSGYQRFLKNITPSSDPHTVLELSIRTANICHSLRNIPQAAAALKTALDFCGSLIRPDHINLYMELLLEMKDYEACVRVLTSHADIRIDYVRLCSGSSEDKSSTIQVTDFSLPAPLPPPELLAKLGITLVHLRSESQFGRLMDSLAFDLETYGDLYLDIVEALIQQSYHSHALQVLKKLVASTKYNQPGVWKQLAETHEKLGHTDECKAAYRRVLEQVPLYLDIRRHLSDIYMKENSVHEAVDVLRQFAIHEDNTQSEGQLPGDEHDDPWRSTRSSEESTPAVSASPVIPPSSAVRDDHSSNSCQDDGFQSPRPSQRSKTGTTPKAKSKVSVKLEPGSAKENPDAIYCSKNELFSRSQVSENADLISASLLMDQLMLMMKTEQSYERKDEYFSLLKLLLSQTSIKIKSAPEAKIIMTRGRYSKKLDSLANLRGVSKLSIMDNRNSFAPEPPVKTQDLLTLYRHCFDIAKKDNDFMPLLDIVVQMFGSPLFISEQTPTSAVDQFTLEASLVLYSTGYIDYCYTLFRPILLKYLDSKAVLNLINLIMIRVDDTHVFRNTMRTFRSKPENFGLNVLYANNCNLTGNYKYCINEYAIISRNAEHKNPLYLLLLAVSYTNIACTRFMDKKALLVGHALAWISKYKETRGAVMSQEILYNSGRMFHQLGLLSQAVCFYKQALSSHPCLSHYDLRYDIAYNLHLVYLQSKSYNLARDVMNRYLVV